MGDPVPGRPVAQRVRGQVAGVGLDHRPRLHRGQGRGGLLHQPDDLDQLAVRASPTTRPRPGPGPPRPRRRAPPPGEARRGRVPRSTYGEANQAPPTARAISTGFIPTFEIIHRKYFRARLSSTRGKDRHPSEHPRPTARRKRTGGGTATHHHRHHTRRSSSPAATSRTAVPTKRTRTRRPRQRVSTSLDRRPDLLDRRTRTWVSTSLDRRRTCSTDERRRGSRLRSTDERPARLARPTNGPTNGVG